MKVYQVYTDKGSGLMEATNVMHLAQLILAKYGDDVIINEYYEVLKKEKKNAGTNRAWARPNEPHRISCVWPLG